MTIWARRFSGFCPGRVPAPPASPRKLSVNSATRAILGENARFLLIAQPYLFPAPAPKGRAVALLPLPVLHAAGRVLGRLIYAWPGRYRQRLRANAAQAGYPDAAFARRAAAETGAMILEMPKVWFRSAESLSKVVSDDFHVVEAALAERRG